MKVFLGRILKFLRTADEMNDQLFGLFGVAVFTFDFRLIRFRSNHSRPNNFRNFDFNVLGFLVVLLIISIWFNFSLLKDLFKAK